MLPVRPSLAGISGEGAQEHQAPVVVGGSYRPLEENLWLKGLAKDLNAKTARSILEESRKKGKEAEVAAYLYALINANLKTIEEALAMADEGLPFDRLVEEIGLAAKLRAEGEARGEKNGWKKALEFLKQGHTVEELERMSPPVPTGK